MIETMVTMTYRMACDRCGKTSHGWHKSVERALQVSKAAGSFLDAGYQENGVKFVRHLCRECFFKPDA